MPHHVRASAVTLQNIIDGAAITANRLMDELYNIQPGKNRPVRAPAHSLLPCLAAVGRICKSDTHLLAHSHARSLTRTHTHTHTHIYIYIFTHTAKKVLVEIRGACAVLPPLPALADLEAAAKTILKEDGKAVEEIASRWFACMQG